MVEIITGLSEVMAGLLIAIFSKPLAKASIGLNKRTLGVELPFEWCRTAALLVGGLLSFSGVLKLLNLTSF